MATAAEPELLAADRPPVAFAPPGLAGERLRQARLYRRWHARRAAGGLPALADMVRDVEPGDRCVALFELGDAGEIVLRRCRGAAPAWLPRLLGRVAERLPAMRVSRAPLACEARIADAATGTIHLRALMLPFADDAGALRYVAVSCGWATVATAHPGILLLDPGEAAREPPRPSEASPAALLGAARAWAIIAARAPENRLALAAALSSLFDALLLLAPAEAPMAGGLAPGAIRRAIDLTFGRHLARGPARRLRLLLRHAARLGLATGMLGGLLRRDPAALDRMVAAERRRPATIARRGGGGSMAVPAIRLRLVPIEAGAPRPRRDAAPGASRIADADGCPWPVRAADRAIA